ncbi:MAG: rhodanese-like domain-containing protein [Brooklawnia sp.]|nr:rhodanese-like domain-containing protein [Brooklawnia sp.]
MQVVRGLLALIAVLALLPVAACAPASVSIDASTVVIDVRTPAEYSAGHLESATLLDLNSGQFQEALSQLDPDTRYAVYCRSGNRSGQAVAMMAAAGFSDVTDLGAIGDASRATGLEIVTG